MNRDLLLKEMYSLDRLTLLIISKQWLGILLHLFDTEATNLQYEKVKGN